jgi:hypothetical protein
MILKRWLIVALAGFALSLGNQSRADILNGDFETGTFQYWTQSGDLSYTNVISPSGNSSTYAAHLGPPDPAHPGYLSQDFSTVVGLPYILKFDLAYDYGGRTFDYFSASLIGNSVQQNTVVTNDPGSLVVPGLDVIVDPRFQDDGNYHTLTYSFTADTSTTTLQFQFYAMNTFFYLDNVSVTEAAPEPSTLTIAAIGGVSAGIFGLRRRRRHTQV